MQRRTVIYLVIGIIVGIMIGSLLTKRQADIAGNVQESGSGAIVAGTSTLPITLVTIHDASAPLYKLAIEYPQFPTASTDFNASVADFVKSNLDDFKTIVPQNWQARIDTAPSGTAPQAPEQLYYFSVSWEPAEITTHYLSFIVRMAAFEGGANENQEIMTFNYDFQKKAPIELASFFHNDPNYLSTVSQLVRTQLSASLKDASPGYDPTSMLNEGTTPDIKNFQNFTFTDDVLTIYFPKYQVAPGAFGEQKASFVRSAL